MKQNVQIFNSQRSDKTTETTNEKRETPVSNNIKSIKPVGMCVTVLLMIFTHHKYSLKKMLCYSWC